MCHYLHGAWFPEGGAGRIAGCVEKVIESRGGACLVGWEATKILVDGGRTRAVAAQERFGTGRRVFSAPIIISDIGIRETCERLLDGWPNERLRSRVLALGHGHSAVTLYLGLSESLAELGITGENLWIYESGEHDDIAGMSRDLLEGRPRNAYISFPSLKKQSKAREDCKHTVEIISPVSPDFFSAWKETGPDDRRPEYRALKARISEGLLALAERHIPGIASLVVYAELSTPLSITHYTSHSEGAFYGLPVRPQRYRRGGFSPRAGIRGLYFAGSDVSSLGISGAMMGGVAAACMAMHWGGFRSTFMSRLRDSSRTLPAAARTLPDTGQHFQGRVVHTTEVSPSVFELGLRIERRDGLSAEVALPLFKPGQFVKLLVADTEWREYSIIRADARTLTLLISARADGRGPRFARNAMEGDSVDLRMPFGSFVLFAGERRKIFIATGTGLAPIVAQIASLSERRFVGKVDLYFGCPCRADDLTPRYLKYFQGSLDLKIVVCTSREMVSHEGFVNGRVSGAIHNLIFDPSETEFYLAGNPRMIEEVTKILDERGACHVRAERF